MNNKFSELLLYFHTKNNVSGLSWNKIAEKCEINPQKLHAWRTGLYKPESKKIEGKEKAHSEVHRLAQFFELTEKERIELFKAAGFDDVSEPRNSPKMFFYFNAIGFITREQKRKLAKPFEQIRNLFSEFNLTTQSLEMEGKITDEKLKEIRDFLYDNYKITLCGKEEKK